MSNVLIASNEGDFGGYFPGRSASGSSPRSSTSGPPLATEKWLSPSEKLHQPMRAGAAAAQACLRLLAFINRRTIPPA